jgi:hypothetical protein
VISAISWSAFSTACFGASTNPTCTDCHRAPKSSAKPTRIPLAPFLACPDRRGGVGAFRLSLVAQLGYTSRIGESAEVAPAIGVGCLTDRRPIDTTFTGAAENSFAAADYGVVASRRGRIHSRLPVQGASKALIRMPRGHRVTSLSPLSSSNSANSAR